MLEITRILAGISLVSLLLAIAAVLSPLGRQQLRRLDGAPAVNDRYLRMATYLLLAAVGLSAVAAALAIAGWFAP